MSSPKFKIHVNRAMGGKKYYTAREYYSDMKKMGLEPENEGQIAKRTRKKYEGVSSEARQMMASVTYDKKTGKPNLGDRYYDALKKMGMREVPKEIRDAQRGGFYGR